METFAATWAISTPSARKVIAAGFYLGLGGVVTFKNSGMDNVVKAVGPERIILETDAPYLTPHPHRGQRTYAMEEAYPVLRRDSRRRSGQAGRLAGPRRRPV